MVLQFGRSSGRKGDTDDDGDVVEESKGPFDLVVDILDAEDASAVCQHAIDPETSNEKGKTHASWRIPAAARRMGDNPTLEMIVAVGLELLTAIPPPMSRRVQKRARKSHPRRPWTPCLTTRKRTGMMRTA